MILDTNAVSALLAGDATLRRILVRADRHELPVIVIGEYKYGLRRSKYRRSLEPLLTQLIRGSRVLDVDATTSDQYADVRSALRERGHPLPENDVWIAALALQHDLPVVSRDEDFDRVPGLRVVRW